MTPKALYERVGGMSFFEALTDTFYAAVEGDEVLRPLYPDDLGPPRRRLCLFLAQFFGGPRVYSAERGDPRLQARHAPFRIGPRERDRWLHHMTAAIDATGLPGLERERVLGQITAAARQLVNTEG